MKNKDIFKIVLNAKKVFNNWILKIEFKTVYNKPNDKKYNKKVVRKENLWSSRKKNIKNSLKIEESKKIKKK